MKGKYPTLQDVLEDLEVSRFYIHRAAHGSPDNRARRFMALYLRQGKPPELASRLARDMTYLDIAAWNPANLATPA